MMDVDQAAKAMPDEEMQQEIEDFIEGFNQPTYRGMWMRSRLSRRSWLSVTETAENSIIGNSGSSPSSSTQVTAPRINDLRRRRRQMGHIYRLHVTPYHISLTARPIV